ncbi:DUF899 domain-containing protein [Streptomyces sp. H10-C2]|uniref:DUF899 domain-containing protein n=1 Tax=unclassified Streptomyces TaxID=2593676 RepID=UPI0024B8BB53|nr:MULTISPECIES: DUF899 domain-containing protein [unclassified Streptomyces]MDJ0347632.1 DUF899 domain-containing protein [Streptomyces sp. PH10-H1]MDJ0375806.1 DUF899 domain-containing protein [Streptomyces sp. H10-C2]
MALPQVVSRDEWLIARKELLAKEKGVTRAQAAVDAQRRELPMVKLTKDYKLAGPAGPASLLDLFEGRRQLIVYHFMFDPSWDEGCPSCSLVADNIGHLVHLHGVNTSLSLVSRAPLAKIEPFKARMGWTVPWFSSYESDFNYDFHVSNDASVAPVEYNYKDEATLQHEGLAHFVSNEGHGASVFLRDGDSVFHTYSAYGRGVDLLLGTYHYLDLTPLGRQRYVTEFLHHDRYDGAAGHSCH